MNKPRLIPITITFGQLKEVLASLGFEQRETDEFTAYQEADHDALIILPRMSPEAIVGDPYLVAIRSTVTGRGVATSEKLYSLLEDSARANGADKILTRPRSRKKTERLPVQTEREP